MGKKFSGLIDKNPTDWPFLSRETLLSRLHFRQPSRGVNLPAASTDEVSYLSKALDVCQVRVYMSPALTAMDEVMCYTECRSEVA